MKYHISAGLLGKFSSRSLILTGLSVNCLIATLVPQIAQSRARNKFATKDLLLIQRVWECCVFSYILVSLGAHPSPSPLNFKIRQICRYEYSEHLGVPICNHVSWLGLFLFQWLKVSQAGRRCVFSCFNHPTS